jgi:hypothetical protein
MSFLTHSDPSIKAAGDLAEDLKQCGQPVEIHYNGGTPASTTPAAHAVAKSL